MKFNSQNFLTLNILFSSSLMILSSSNWMFSWMMMELSFMTFLPLMTQSPKISYQMMKFFIIQSMSSSLMLFMMTMENIYPNKINLMIMLISFLMKMGIAPLSFWMPMMFSFMNLYSCLLMSTIQKIGPMILMSQFIPFSMLKPSIMLSLLIGSISSMKQNKFKKFIAFISISSMAWMILSIYMSKLIFIKFMFIYYITNLFLIKILMQNNIISINQMWYKSLSMKIYIQSFMLSIMGMPPMLGFLPKWMILKNFTFLMGSMSLFLVLTSFMQSISFMKMSINNIILSSSSLKTTNKIMKEKVYSLFMIWTMIYLPILSLLNL
uniref:NADH-ubiquinone oxidoreductase chain 2 n=1 Tax=Nisia fuliginosa TaxID=2743077 RepID=A0A8A4JFQ8_9HEMI|nr:NADH dehydrogenase subunit 2 [Nisia fuliginosa]